ncbi:MAG: IS91 family transposase, partial [Bacteroidetes bacterium]|nr:IS91 family transposase [Bacteroidota bacterium]
MREACEVADILQQQITNLSKLTANTWQIRTLQAIADCRTHALGGHIDKCDNPKCNHIHISYNSCRNRHCPKCQGNKREEWISKREGDLLNVPYYHVVFTLPDHLNKVCLYEPGKIYGLMFKTAWSVIRSFAFNPKFLGAKTGMIAILHTWGQNLTLHPHLHCIVPGGGITAGGKWKAVKGKDKYLFPVKALSKVFRARFVEYLRKEMDLPGDLYKELFSKQWVVYCKRPFWGPQQVVEYLGRYTHKIAISNHRIRDIQCDKVIFMAKDYRHGGKTHPVTLSQQEFIRRFAMHILPRAFVRIRHYGILSSVIKNSVIPRLQQELGEPVLPARPIFLHRQCPCCRKGRLITLYMFKGRAPPRQNVLN